MIYYKLLFAVQLGALAIILVLLSSPRAEPIPAPSSCLALTEAALSVAFITTEQAVLRDLLRSIDACMHRADSRTTDSTQPSSSSTQSSTNSLREQP